MFNCIKSKPLYEVSKILSLTAMGEKPADLVIKNAKLVNVCTKEIIENIDVAISEGRIALVGKADHCIGENTRVIDAKGEYLAPGFLDGHIHVESSMMSVAEYASAVVCHGTVGIFSDPHEICNVLGMDGVKIMMEESKGTPLKNMITIPSCVPAVKGFEDSGHEISVEDVAEAMKSKQVVGLGEMMNYPGILSGDEKAHGVVSATLREDKTVTGHYPSDDLGAALNAYIASGANCCHESTTEEQALAKMRLGMYAMLREGSSWCDMEEVAKAITKHEVDSRFAVLVSDDAHPDTLLANGHMDYIMKRAVEEGIDVLSAIQMVTINTAQCFHMDRDLGSITPGKCADIVFLKDLDSLEVTRTIIDGEVVAEAGKLVKEIKHYDFPAYATSTMHVGEVITKDSFKIKARADKNHIRVIGAIPGKALTISKDAWLNAKEGYLESDVSQDIMKVVVFERHHKTGTKGMGFIEGFHLKRGAMASTVAHDAHNLMVIGANDEDMALAANTLIECGGGLCVVLDGKVLGLVPLPIAGLMNDKPAEEMQAMIVELEKGYKEVGCDVQSPFMTMAIASLACIPELRLTNKGLVDCNTFTMVDLFLEE